MKLLTAQEREEVRQITKLQRLNCYDGLIKRLSQRWSAPEVARWAMSLNIEGAPGTWTFWYWRKQIVALAKHVRIAKEKIRHSRPKTASHLPDPQIAAIVEQVATTTAQLLCRDVIPDILKDVWDKTELTLHLLTAEQMLKSVFYIEMERLGEVRAFEKKMGMPLDNTHKEIEKLSQLGAAVAKLELGAQFLRGKLGNGPYLPPVSEIKPGDSAQLEEEFMQFDEIDRNLIRQVTHNVIQMVREGVSGRFEAGRLDAVSGGEEG